MIKDKCNKYIGQLEKADKILANMTNYVSSNDARLATGLVTACELSGELINYIKNPKSIEEDLFEVNSMFTVQKSANFGENPTQLFNGYNEYECEARQMGDEFGDSKLESSLTSSMGSFSSLSDGDDCYDSDDALYEDKFGYREREDFYEEYASLPDYVEVLKRNVSYVDFLKAHPKLMLRNKANIILSYMVGKWGYNSEGLTAKEPRIYITDINEYGFMTEPNNKFLVKLGQFNELFKEVKPRAVQVTDDNEFATKLARVFYTLADRPGITKEGIEVIIKKFIFAVERKGFMLKLNSANIGKQLILDIIERIPDASVHVGWRGYVYSEPINVKELFERIMANSASIRDIELFSEHFAIQWENRKFTSPAYKALRCTDLLQFGRPKDENMLGEFLTKVTRTITRSLDKLASVGVEVPVELYDINVDDVTDLQRFLSMVIESHRYQLDRDEYNRAYNPGRYFKDMKRGNY